MSSDLMNSVDLFDVINLRKGVLICGGAGNGKTSLLKSVAKYYDPSSVSFLDSLHFIKSQLTG
jgi:Flp pilus assembly CpaF family ATPase